MPASDLTGPFAALADSEREILRLLASGHTAKSIAPLVGRSEAAVNERLREARRKTGMGSSRELARLFVAQEFRDEKIDLTGRDETADPYFRPHKSGAAPKKGSKSMMIAAPLVAAAALLASPVMPGLSASGEGAGMAGTQSAASPLVGHWELDVSRIPEAERPRGVTITFARAADARWSTTVRIVSPDGTVREATSTAAADGMPVAVSGFDFVDTASLRQPSPTSLVMTLAKDGRPVSTRVYAVSADGRTMTETIVWAGGSVPRLETTHFTRVD